MFDWGLLKHGVPESEWSYLCNLSMYICLNTNLSVLMTWLLHIDSFFLDSPSVSGL